jgi:hypothetical protein
LWLALLLLTFVFGAEHPWEEQVLALLFAELQGEVWGSTARARKNFVYHRLLRE